MLNDALLTIISKNNSKVDLKIVNIVNGAHLAVKPFKMPAEKITKKSQSLNPKLTRQDCLPNESEPTADENKPDLLNSFIMFEAGLENIGVNGVKNKIIADVGSDSSVVHEQRVLFGRRHQLHLVQFCGAFWTRSIKNRHRS